MLGIRNKSKRKRVKEGRVQNLHILHVSEMKDAIEEWKEKKQWLVILARLNEKTGPENGLSIAFLLNRTNIPLNRSPLPLIATMLLKHICRKSKQKEEVRRRRRRMKDKIVVI